MKSVVCILSGLVAGWFLTESDDLMPAGFNDWVGQAVAGSETVAVLLGALPVASAMSESIHIWLIIAALTVIPIFFISLFAAGVYAWTGKARLLAYTSLIWPLFMACMGVYYTRRMAAVDPLIARSFWSNTQGNVQFYLYSAAAFVLLFVVLVRISNSMGWAGSQRTASE